MYHGIVKPRFRYCCSLRGSCSETRLQTLQRLQNRAARIVTNTGDDTSTAILIKKLNWPIATDMIKSKKATIIYNALSGYAPGYRSNPFLKNSSARDINMHLCTAYEMVPKMKAM